MAGSMKTVQRSTHGQLYKGQAIVAASASIPTKFQTLVSDNSDKNGFLSRSKRFVYDTGNELPAPCQYVHHIKFDKLSPSFSEKGSGGLASKSKRRFKNILSNAPGPGLYSVPKLLTSRTDFNKRRVTSTFAPPIALLKPKSNGIPAPNVYKLDRAKTGRVNNVTADAAFKSKSKREALIAVEQSRLPAPCCYDVHDEVTYRNTRVPFSSFKSQSKREIMKPHAFPGPGHYRPNEEVEPAKRLVYPRKHYLCISAPAMPLPETPPLPGPGSYEIVNFQGPSKHFMSSSVFVSTSGRWTGPCPSFSITQLPGPAHYRPAPQAKQSFIYNVAGKWL